MKEHLKNKQVLFQVKVDKMSVNKLKVVYLKYIITIRTYKYLRIG